MTACCLSTLRDWGHTCYQVAPGADPEPASQTAAPTPTTTPEACGYRLEAPGAPSQAWTESRGRIRPEDVVRIPLSGAASIRLPQRLQLSVRGSHGLTNSRDQTCFHTYSYILSYIHICPPVLMLQGSHTPMLIFHAHIPLWAPPALLWQIREVQFTHPGQAVAGQGWGHNHTTP